ncbi:MULTISPECIES: DUF4126 family protein [Methylobacterium]|uniref:DUF4126 domain-containing protein n=1 Tax=Methylobacterium bullatum TaxID=570505 RepID=A0A679KH47_9HYPH|nr:MULTISPECIES: DUF4126 family protein [Methylobacterium]KQO44790.1 hypothetical protein ASF08_07105 [Methylobacterium sp. Leaf85]GJD39828.1 hypothetical protein OICFNHDK_2292 [Methylobacterium bullatum]CAA2144847.1 hypothetical protein MBLL_03968 [Methylobacterium bullatum]
MAGIVLAGLIGMVAGLRTFTAPAAIAWAAHLGWISLDGSWLAFLGYRSTAVILTLLALAEFVTDTLPATPSRTVPVQFAARIASGTLCGGAIGIGLGQPVAGALAGAAGAVIGTLGGARARARMAAAFGSDRPAAFTEDAVAVVAAILVASAL